MDILELDSTESSPLGSNWDTLATGDEFFTASTKVTALNLEF